MSIAVAKKKKVWTEAELEALPGDGYLHEVVNGELVEGPRFSSGTRIAWVIDPDRELVEICHSPAQRRLLGPGGSLTGEDLLPGFHYAITDLFKEWEW